MRGGRLSSRNSSSGVLPPLTRPSMTGMVVSVGLADRRRSSELLSWAKPSATTSQRDGMTCSGLTYTREPHLDPRGELVEAIHHLCPAQPPCNERLYVLDERGIAGPRQVGRRANSIGSDQVNYRLPLARCQLEVAEGPIVDLPQPTIPVRHSHGVDTEGQADR